MSYSKQDEAKQAAMLMAEEVRRKGVDSALVALERALHDFEEQGYPIESILPSGHSGLGFALGGKPEGKSFWSAYAEVIREALCKPGSEFEKLTKAGLSGSAGAILPALVAGLHFPPAALGIAIPMAAMLAAMGVDAFCRFTELEKKPEHGKC